MSPSLTGELLWEVAGPLPPTRRFSEKWFTDATSPGPVFEVGRSDPAIDWPRLHPGPLNESSGYRELSATVLFQGGDVTRRHVLEVEAREASGPCPDLRFDLNGHTARMVPRASRTDRRNAPVPPSPVSGVISRELWFPPGAVTDGANRLVVTTVAPHPFDPSDLGPQQRPDLGSWFGSTLQWVRLGLRREFAGSLPPEPDSDVTMTPLYRERPDGTLEEMVEAVVYGVADLSGTRIRVRAGSIGADWENDGTQDSGDVRLTLAYPEAPPADGAPRTIGVSRPPAPVTATVTLSGPAGERTMTHECRPARKWTVHVLPHVHLDIGYTDRQAKVVELHSRNLDKALAILDDDEEWAFSIDGSFVVQQFLRSRRPEQAARLLDALRSGRLSVNALWALLLTGVAGLEDLYRALSFAARLRRDDGVPITYANLTDVPSYSAALPSILAAAGIDAFLGIANHTRGANADSDALHLLSPVRWRGPDGAEVLAFFADCYSQLRFVCADPPSIPGMAQGLSRFVTRYDRPDYLPEHLPLVGSHADNEDLSHGYAGLVARWNAEYAWPRLRFSTVEGYLETVRPLRDWLPEIVGDGGSYWEDGVGTQAVATARARRNQARLPSVEAVSALVTATGDGLRPDVDVLDEAWECVLLGSEHTWTWAHTTSHPHARMGRDQLGWKVSRIERARQIVEDESRRALSQLAELVTSPDVPAVLVVNPTGTDRTVIVDLELAEGESIVGEDGRALPTETEPPVDGLVSSRARVEALPPFGYRLLPVRSGIAPAPHEDAPAPEWFDTPHYRVAVDAVSGAVTGLVRARDAAQVLDRHSRFTLGDVVYARGGGSAETRGLDGEVSSLSDYDPTLPTVQLDVTAASMGPATWRRTPWGHVLERAGHGPTMPSIRERIELFDDSERVEVTVDLEKEPTLAKESIYVAFPFDIPDPSVHYDRQQGWIDPAVEHQVGACNEWFTVQYAVVMGHGERSVAWASADAPLFTVGDVVRGTWPRRFRPPNATILSWIMNNYWMTNTPAQQSGPVRLRYAFEPGDGLDPVAAGRLGRALRHGPLVSDLLATDRCDDEPRPWPSSGTLYPLGVPNNVVVGVFAGRGDARFTLRVQEIGGRSTTVHLPHPGGRAAGWAATATATETLLERRPLVEGAVSLVIGPWEVQTVCFGD